MKSVWQDSALISKFRQRARKRRVRFRFRIELAVDNRVNRSTLSANGIRNAVSLQPVLYVGGIPNINHINLTGSGLNAYGFQGCLSSFIVDGRLLDYQRALVIQGKMKMNVCSGKDSFRWESSSIDTISL